MSTSVELLHGLLHLPTGQVDVSAHRDWLADHGVLAALGTVDEGSPAVFNVAVRAGRPLRLVDGSLATPWSVPELLGQLTDAVGGLVEVPEYREFVGDRSLDTTPVVNWPPAHPVLLSVVADAEHPAPAFTEQLKVRHLSGVEDGWSVVRFDREVPVVGYDWPAAQLPAVWLHADRTLAIQGAPGGRPQVVLQHFRAPELVPLRLGDQVPGDVAEVLAALSNPQLSASSELGDLTSLPAFADVDVVAVATALQAPVTDEWSAGVLQALGLPTLAADVAEGRREVPGAEANPAENVSTVFRSLRDLDEAAERDPGAATLVTKLYGTSTRHPLMALATIVPEILVGVALLVVLAGSAEHPWWHWLVGIFAVACLTDAAIDSVMMVRRLRRSR